MKTSLPETGYLRLTQIVGQKAVTTEQAEANRQQGKKPRTARPEIPPIIPICKSSWWNGVRSGIYPAPVKLAPRTTAWRIEDIRVLIEKLHGGDV